MSSKVVDYLLNNVVDAGGGGGGYPEPTGTKSITQNGTGIDVKDYAAANVNVPNSYTAQDEGKVVDNGALVAQSSRNITQNGTVDTTLNNEVVVNVQSQTPTLITKSITQNGTYNAQSDSADGYSEVTVAVQAVSDENAIIERSLRGDYTNAVVTKVGSFAFAYMTFLVNASFSEALQIKESAFLGCQNLVSVSAPKATSIGADAFKQSKLNSASFPLVTSLGSNAFQECRQLASVSLPNLTDVNGASYAFANCSALTSLSLDKITEIPQSFCSGASRLESVNMPLVATVGSNAFSGCTALTSISLPSATRLRGSTFGGCTHLASVNLPALTTFSGGNDFQNCTSLTSIELPLVTGKMGSYMFMNCTALETVDLTAITSLDNYSIFQGCTHLTALIIRNTSAIVPISSTALNNTAIKNGTGYVYVPDALKSQYQAATNWSTVSSQFRSLEDYTIDGTTTGALDPTKI